MVLPGGGEPQSDFVGLEAPPVLETVEPGGLELLLKAPRLAGLSPGAPVTFRQVRIGSVLRVRLASDASTVEVDVYIRPTYARLVCDNSKFWNTSGVRGSAHWRSGISLAVESAESLLTGGIAMATESPAGKEARSGARFPLLPEAPKGWEEWKPPLKLTDARLREGAIAPKPVVATLQYRTPGRVYGHWSGTGRGLVVPTGRDLLGPSDLLTVPAKSKGELRLAMQPEVIRTVEPADTGPASNRPTIRWLVGALEQASGAAPGLRVPSEPEECLLVGNPDQEYRSVSVGRLKQKDNRWEVDPELFSDTGPEVWHGAAVVGKDGKVIGLLLAPKRQKPYVAFLDKQTVHPPRQ
jgi:hypothetical protein